MNDRVLGTFDDEETALKAAEHLVGAGVDRRRVRVGRVLDPGHRGLGDADKVHSLLHAPRIDHTDPVTDDAGIVVLIVEMSGSDDDSSGGDSASMTSRLDSLGAIETTILEATPGLDLK